MWQLVAKKCELAVAHVGHFVVWSEENKLLHSNMPKFNGIAFKLPRTGEEIPLVLLLALFVVLFQ